MPPPFVFQNSAEGGAFKIKYADTYPKSQTGYQNRSASLLQPNYAFEENAFFKRVSRGGEIKNQFFQFL